MSTRASSSRSAPGRPRGPGARGQASSNALEPTRATVRADGGRRADPQAHRPRRQPPEQGSPGRRRKPMPRRSSWRARRGSRRRSGRSSSSARRPHRARLDRLISSPRADPTCSTWSVVWSIPKLSCRRRSSSSRIRWQSAPGCTRTCAERAGGLAPSPSRRGGRAPRRPRGDPIARPTSPGEADAGAPSGRCDRTPAAATRRRRT